jgi:hypothetical protein
MVSPQIIFMKVLNNDYHGIYMMQSDAEPHYLAKMQETYDGNKIGNAYYYEEKAIWPVVYYTISERVLAIPGIIFGISVPNINLIYKFIFPFICSIVSYILLLKLTGNKKWSIIGTCLIMFGSPLTSLVDIKHIISLDPVYTQFSLFSRPINPQFSFIFFAVYLYFLYSIIKENKRWISVMLGIIFGFCIYLYFYTFLFIVALNVVSIVFFIFYKDKRYVSISLIFATIIGLCIGLREILELYSLYSSPLLSLVSDLKISSSNRPVLGIFQAFSYLIFLIYLFSDKIHRKNPQTLFISTLLLTTFVVLNQQVITHYSIQYGHFHWYFNVPIYFIMIAYVFMNWSTDIYMLKSKKIITTLFYIIVSLAILFTFFIQYSSFKNNYKHIQSIQGLGRIFIWLENNADHDCVVMADKEISELIPVFTHCDVLEADYGKSYLLSENRRDYGNIEAINDLNKYGQTKYKVDFLVCRDCIDQFPISSQLKKLTLKEDDFELYKITQFNRHE